MTTKGQMMPTSRVSSRAFQAGECLTICCYDDIYWCQLPGLVQGHPRLENAWQYVVMMIYWMPWILWFCHTLFNKLKWQILLSATLTGQITAPYLYRIHDIGLCFWDDTCFQELQQSGISSAIITQNVAHLHKLSILANVAMIFCWTCIIQGSTQKKASLIINHDEQCKAFSQSLTENLLLHMDCWMLGLIFCH